MKRNALIILALFIGLLAIGFLCEPPKAGAQVIEPPPPVQLSLGAIKARTQIAVGLQREWISRRGIEAATPSASWVAVIPASFNVTPTTDVVAQFGYNMTSHATRYVVGVRFVVFGAK